MKLEKGSILEIFVIGIVALMIIGIFTVIFIEIKQDIEYGIKKGQVIDKSYQAAYTTMQYNSNSIAIPQYHPERYQIEIQKEIEGKTKSIWISVDKDTYHSINVGDYYGERKDTNENTESNK